MCYYCKKGCHARCGRSTAEECLPCYEGRVKREERYGGIVLAIIALIICLVYFQTTREATVAVLSWPFSSAEETVPEDPVRWPYHDRPQILLYQCIDGECSTE